MVASKRRRLSLAAGAREPTGERLLDVSPRRDHGTDAAIKAARAVPRLLGTATATEQWTKLPIRGGPQLAFALPLR